MVKKWDPECCWASTHLLLLLLRLSMSSLVTSCCRKMSRTLFQNLGMKTKAGPTKRSSSSSGWPAFTSVWFAWILDTQAFKKPCVVYTASKWKPAGYGHKILSNLYEAFTRASQIALKARFSIASAFILHPSQPIQQCMPALAKHSGF